MSRSAPERAARLTLADVRRMPDAALSRSQVADLMGVDPRSVTRAIEDGTIPAVRFGRRICIPREALLRVLDGAPQKAA